MAGGPPGVPQEIPGSGGTEPLAYPYTDFVRASHDKFLVAVHEAQVAANAAPALRAFQEQMALGQHLMAGASGNVLDTFAGRLVFAPNPATLSLSPPPQRSEEDIRQEKEALDRAYALLEETIGKQEAAKVDAGGAYLIRSKLWLSMTYGVAKTGPVLIFDRRLLRRRKVVGESCLAAYGHNLPWPDVVLAKIKAIQADETIVFATGNVSTR